MVRKILWLLTAQVSNGKTYQNRIVLSTRNKKTQFNRPICTVWWQSYPQTNAAPVIDNSKNIPFFRPPNWCRWPLKLICSSFFVFISQDWMVKSSSWASLLCYFAGILMQARDSLRIHHHHWRGLSKVANQSVGHIRGARRKRMILNMCTYIYIRRRRRRQRRRWTSRSSWAWRGAKKRCTARANKNAKRGSRCVQCQLVCNARPMTLPVAQLRRVGHGCIPVGARKVQRKH